jgi:hypothetical protein
MFTFFAVLAGLYLVGALIMITGMKNAPEGFEDEVGFQLVWQNDNPESENVACIWAFSAAHVPAMNRS